MGDLKGHLIPGSMFILVGFWWTVCCLHRYFSCRRSKRTYLSSIAFLWPFQCGKLTSLPVESFVKVALGTSGVVGESIDHNFNLPLPIVQHVTMYFFFLLSGVLDIVMYFGVPLPPGMDYMTMVLAFTVEGLLFANHLHGREPLDIHVHMLLVYVIFATVIIIALEAKFQRSPILTLARAFLTMLQGTWFWAVGIILYGHDVKTTPWDLSSHDDVMKSTIYFSWHCAILFLVVFLLAAFMSCCYRDVHKYRPLKSNKDISTTTMMEMKAGSNGHVASYDIEDENDESDTEYKRHAEKPLLP